MGCGCEKDRAVDPEGIAWGPVLWKMLHGLAERIGRVVSSQLLQDEKLNWINILSKLPEIIPCDECRQHYKAYLAENPITAMKGLANTDLTTFVKTWLWNLHSSVDKRLGKPTVAFTDLPGLYGSLNLDIQFNTLNRLEKKAVQDGQVKYNSWMLYTKYFRSLLSNYGLA